MTPIRLWWIRLTTAPPANDLLADLSADEQQRAAAFLDATARRRFITARAALRRMLAAALNRAPPATALSVDRHGKPFALDAAAPAFNLAHSADLILLAATPSGAIGVDVEQQRTLPEFDDLAARVMTAREFAAWRQLPAAARSHAFYRLWTAKEALMKCDGRGLRLPPQQIALGLGRPVQRRLTLDGHRLAVRDVPAPLGYSAALAITPLPQKSHRHRLNIQRWIWS